MTEKFTFFWSGPFSQWHPCKFEDNNGVIYNCAEQYMMAYKAKLFGDMAAYKKIMAAEHPSLQKSIGRTVKGFNVDIWSDSAKDIVYSGNHHKFTQNPKLGDKLKATKGTVLIEASPYDTIWGIGLSEDDPRALDRKTWRGSNWLGEVLTRLRIDLYEK